MKVIEPTEIRPEDLAFHLGERRTLFSLYPLLFVGGATKKESGGPWTPPEDSIPDEQRAKLVNAIHEELVARRAQGTSDRTLRNQLYAVRNIYSWADENNAPLTTESLKTSYIRYANSLVLRQRTVGDLKESSVFAMASTLSSLFSSILDLKVALIRLTQVRKPIPQPSYVRDKATLADSDTMRMGKALRLISDSVCLDTVAAALPLEIELEPGKVLKLGRRKKEVSRDSAGRISMHAIRLERRLLLNFVTEVEMHIFISQTSMNLAQVRNLRVEDFRIPQRSGNSELPIAVKLFKNRRNGEVIFEIYPAYRKYFTRYINWRRSIYDDDLEGPLFKFLTPPGLPPPAAPQELLRVKNAFKSLDIPYRTARQLRSLRGNFLKSRTGSAELAAEIGSHTRSTFDRYYSRVDVTTALREVATFHEKNDPAIAPAGPGRCVNAPPQLVERAPEGAPVPDCIKPSGCLFCINQRDIRSFDHIWSLVSFRHLKQIELSKDKGASPNTNPAYLVVQRISQKVSLICTEPDTNGFLEEASYRVMEGDFHPFWRALIDLAEKTI